MKFWQTYSNIENFLHRFTILKIGKLHIRLHKIKSADKTTLFHNHPFHYISVILKGGYTEKILFSNTIKEKTHNVGKVIFRKNDVFHRIEKLKKETITLFITWGKYEWKALNASLSKNPDGVFQRKVKNKILWCKRINDVWFIGNTDKDVASLETRHSIHQV